MSLRESAWRSALNLLLQMYDSPDDAAYDQALRHFQKMAELADVAVAWAPMHDVSPDVLERMRCAPIDDLRRVVKAAET